MQTALENAPQPQPSRVRIVWVQVLVLTAILTWFRVQDYRHTRDAWNAHQTESARLRMIDYAAMQQISSFNATIIATQHRRASLPELAQKFNRGHDFPVSGSDLLCIDPISGGRVTIHLFPDNTLALVTPEFNRPGPPSIPEPSIAALVVAFFSSIVGCLVLLCLYIGASQKWAERLRPQRIASAWKLVVVGIIVSHLAWMGSKFFPGWEPFGDAQLLGYEIGFASFGLLFLFSAYLSRKPTELTPRCHRCRYDLTGNLSGICPECGMAISNI